jgi:HK97 family phage prohead protease
MERLAQDVLPCLWPRVALRATHTHHHHYHNLKGNRVTTYKKERHGERHRSLPLLTEQRFHADPDSIEVRTEGKRPTTATVTGEAIVWHRSDRDATYKVFDGYGPSGSFRERILPGACDAILQRGDPVKLLLGHNSAGVPLASTDSGSMSLQSTNSGLAFTATLDLRSVTNHDVAIAVENKVLQGVSIGFQCGEDRWSGSEDDELREILSIKSMQECSLVCFPASPGTNAAVTDVRDQGVRFRRALSRAQRGQLTAGDIALLDVSNEKLTEGDIVERMRERLTLTRQAKIRGRMHDLLAEQERRTERSRKVRTKARRVV